MSAIKFFKTAFRVFLRGLSFMASTNRRMSRPLDNAIISWWRERDLRPELVPCLRRPPSLAVPVDDEEVLIAIQILWAMEEDGADWNALREGKLRKKRSHIVWPLVFVGFGLVVLALGWITYGQPTVGFTADEIAHWFGVMLVMAILFPVAGYGLFLSTLKTAREAGHALLGGSAVIMFAAYWIMQSLLPPPLASFIHGPAWHLVIVCVSLLLLSVAIMGLLCGAMMGLMLGAIHNERAVS